MELLLDKAVDQPILTALRTGDHRRAATLLVQSYGPVLYRVSRLVSPAQAADDLTYGCFAHAFSSIAQLRGSSPRAWLLDIGREACRARLQQLAAGDLDDDSTGSLAPDLAVEPDEARRAYEQLPPLARALLGLHLSDLLSTEELAEPLGLAVVDLDRRLASTLGTLAARLSPDTERLATAPASTAAYPLLLGSLQAMRWRIGPALERRLEVLVAAL